MCHVFRHAGWARVGGLKCPALAGLGRAGSRAELVSGKAQAGGRRGAARRAGAGVGCTGARHGRVTGGATCCLEDGATCGPR